MKGGKSKNPRKQKTSSSFKPSALVVNYSHSTAYSSKPSSRKNKNYSRKEKILYYIKDFGLPLAALLVSLGTLWYVIVQTDISEQAMRISNRPYVGIDRIAHNGFTATNVLSMTVTIKNGGQTPAYNTHVIMRVDTISANAVNEIPKFRPEDRFPNQYYIPTNDTKDITKNWGVITDSVYNKTDYREIVFMVHGIIAYDDIFGETHSTEFGFKYDPIYSVVEYCKDHNNAN